MIRGSDVCNTYFCFCGGFLLRVGHSTSIMGVTLPFYKGKITPAKITEL